MGNDGNQWETVVFNSINRDISRSRRSVIDIFKMAEEA